MRAEKVIKALLEAAAGVTALTGTRLHGMTRPEGDSLPAIVWMVISDGPEPPIDATAGNEPCAARVQVNCLGTTVEEVKGLAEQARLACHLQSGTFDGVAVMSVVQEQGGGESYDALVEIYTQSIDFIVRYMR